ncbi:MAG: hypothetical protein EBZ74_03880 [Planctomycetia bacterium]|nr:hypothetical protein [Planctomycetia bacterium]
MQDAIAIAISVAAGLWLVRTLWRQIAAPSCGKADAPTGSDGFIPLDDLARPGKPDRHDRGL